MSTRALGILQWVGLLVGAAIWITQHLTGFGFWQAACGPSGGSWGLSYDAWQGLLMGIGLTVIVLAEAAAVTVFARTRGANYGDGPAGDGRFGGALPETRLHFFATASIAANAIFFMIILLDGVATIANVACRQA
jgi:hypothetical protein